jgi:GNAT superfamily N-acetyltransferase
MKRLLLFLSLIFAAANIAAMQPSRRSSSYGGQATAIEYQWKFNNIIQQFEIHGFDNKKHIASIQCERLGNQTWKLIKLWVDKDYRNRKIAQLLMTRSFNYAYAVGCKKIFWQVIPLGFDAPTVETLVVIYRSMCQQLIPGRYILAESPDEENPFLAITNMSLILLDA